MLASLAATPTSFSRHGAPGCLTFPEVADHWRSAVGLCYHRVVGIAVGLKSVVGMVRVLKINALLLDPGFPRISDRAD